MTMIELDPKHAMRLAQKARHRARHREALAAKELARYYANREARKEAARVAYAALTDDERKARWTAVKSTPARLAAKQASDRAHTARNKDRAKARMIAWLDNGGREKRNARHLERLRIDPTYRLKHTIGTQLRNAIRSGKGSAATLLGYTPAELRAHLEAQFEPWMTWENYGSEWHVDHRRPIASFDLPREVRECWALSNLQPLRAIDNLRKGARMSADNFA